MAEPVKTLDLNTMFDHVASVAHLKKKIWKFPHFIFQDRFILTKKLDEIAKESEKLGVNRRDFRRELKLSPTYSVYVYHRGLVKSQTVFEKERLAHEKLNSRGHF